MIFSTQYEAALFKRLQLHNDLFSRWTRHLPKREEETPYHSGAHTLRAIEAALKITGRPNNVLEVGFCLGHSATIFLELGAQHVTSVDSSYREQTKLGVELTKLKYDDRFDFIQGTAADVSMASKFDLIFIDGGHDYPDVSADVDTALALGIPWLLFDDYASKWGPGVRPCIEANDLITVAILGNLALCCPSTGWLSGPTTS